MRLDIAHAIHNLHRQKELLFTEIEQALIPEAGRTSIGWALANPTDHKSYATQWNEPKKLIWIAGGFGYHMIGHIANAACMMRPAARLNADTSSILLQQPDDFIDIVNDQFTMGINNLLWGDLPRGGAKYFEGQTRLLIAVSSNQKDDNEKFATVIGSAVNKALDIYRIAA